MYLLQMIYYIFSSLFQLPYYAYLYQKEPPPILKPRWAAGPAPDPVAPGAGGSTMLAMASAAAAMGRPLGTTFAVYSPAPAARPFGLVRPEPRLSVSTEDYVVVDSPRSASTTPKRFLRAQSEVKFSPCSHPKQPHIRYGSRVEIFTIRIRIRIELVFIWTRNM